MLKLRVDDFIGSKSNEFYKHNLENYKKFHNIISTYFSSYVLGVIPSYLDEKMLQWLSEQDNIIIATHGSVHDESKLNEFEGFDKGAIGAILNYIHRIYDRFKLNSCDYIPPHNTIDVNTIDALKDFGYKHIYGGPETTCEAKKYIEGSGLKYIHSEPPLEYGRSDELLERGSVDYLNVEAKNRDVWLCLHWPWEANLSLKFEPLISFLSQLNKDILS